MTDREDGFGCPGWWRRQAQQLRRARGECSTCAHLFWRASRRAAPLISLQTRFMLLLVFVTHSCSRGCLVHPLFPVCFRADFKRAVLSVHEEIKSLSRLPGSPPTWDRVLPRTIAE